MISTIEDFLNTWQQEAAITLKVLHTLSDESLGQKVSPDGRSLGFLTWHITTTLGEMLQHAGLSIKAPREQEPMPSSAAAIAKAYEKGAQAVAEAVRTHCSDSRLGDDVAMYGETSKKGMVLQALIAHPIHHRGQMTVLMRHAGLQVPGVYGPAREEWAALGMPPQP